MDLSKEQQLQIINAKLESLVKQRFSLELDLAIYDSINPGELPEKEREQLKKVLIAMDILEKKKKELE